jgi:hypothetical protein
LLREKASDKKMATIHYAATKGSRELYELLIKHDPTLVDLKNGEEKSAKELFENRFSSHPERLAEQDRFYQGRKSSSEETEKTHDHAAKNH